MSDHRQHVLVTGSAQGLGLAMGEAFAAAGYRVMLSDLAEQALEAAGRRLRDRYGADTVSWARVDVTEDTSIAELTAATRSWSGGVLDVLINNAGLIARGSAEELGTGAWNTVLDVNLGGTFRCARALHPLLRAAQSSSVINLGSLGSSLGMPQRAAYNAAKTAIIGLTRTLAVEWGPSGIRSNAIAPGFIETAMMRSGFEEGLLDEELMTSRIPLRRLGTPKEIAGVALFLASPEASYINGVCLPVDGGTIVDGTFF